MNQWLKRWAPSFLLLRIPAKFRPICLESIELYRWVVIHDWCVLSIFGSGGWRSKDFIREIVHARQHMSSSNEWNECGLRGHSSACFLRISHFSIKCGFQLLLQGTAGGTNWHTFIILQYFFFVAHRHYWTMFKSIIYHLAREMEGKNSGKGNGKVIFARAHDSPDSWRRHSETVASCTAKWKD